jgi:hypothetical protein
MVCIAASLRDLRNAYEILIKILRKRDLLEDEVAKVILNMYLQENGWDSKTRLIFLKDRV